MFRPRCKQLKNVGRERQNIHVQANISDVNEQRRNERRCTLCKTKQKNVLPSAKKYLFVFAYVEKKINLSLCAKKFIMHESCFEIDFFTESQNYSAYGME